MSNITFIDFHDGKDAKRSRIKSHAQSARYRRERMLAAQQHRWRIGAYTAKAAGPVTPDPEPHLDESRFETEGSESSTLSGPSTPRRKKNQRKKVKRRTPPRLPTPPTRSPSPICVALPNEQKNMEIILSQASDWIQGTYNTSWSSHIKQDRLVYDFDNGIETLRDSFLLVSDLVLMNKHAAAFDALNHVLDIMPGLLRNPHPELLYCLLELGAGTTLQNVPLRTMVKVCFVSIRRLDRMLGKPSLPGSTSACYLNSFTNRDKLTLE